MMDNTQTRQSRARFLVNCRIELTTTLLPSHFLHGVRTPLVQLHEFAFSTILVEVFPVMEVAYDSMIQRFPMQRTY